MRALSLLGVAARAEGIRLKREAGAKLRQGILLAAAALFALPSLTFAQIAAWIWLERQTNGLQGTLLLAGANLLLMAVLLFVALRSRSDLVAEQAKALRQQSLAAITTPATLLDALDTLPWQRPAMRLGALILNRIMRSRDRR